MNGAITYPLTMAAEFANVSATLDLLQYSAKINQCQIGTFRTALTLAVESDSENIVAILLDRGADVNIDSFLVP